MISCRRISRLRLIPLVAIGATLLSGCCFGRWHRGACPPGEGCHRQGGCEACRSQDREIINVQRPLGPYSGAVRAGDTLYLSGQLGLDPATGTLAPGGVAEETRQALKNLGRVLREAGFGFEDAVRATVFLTDVGDYAAMNEVYAGFFPDAPPARACVAVAGLVRGARVEISMIAVRGASHKKVSDR